MSNPTTHCSRHLVVSRNLLIGGSLTLLTTFLVWGLDSGEKEVRLAQKADSPTFQIAEATNLDIRQIQSQKSLFKDSNQRHPINVSEHFSQSFLDWKSLILLGLGIFLTGGVSGYLWRSQRQKRAIESLIQKRTQEWKNAYSDCEKKVREQTLQLEAANQAKTQLLSNMSHELRTPLNSISGFVELLRRDSTLTPDQRSNLTIIARNSGYLLNLFNEILEVARLESGTLSLNPTCFNLRRLIDEVMEMLQGKAQVKNIQLSSYLDVAIPQYIKMDEGKLRQVLVNLLDNGIKFTPKGSVNLRIAGSDDGWAFTDDSIGLHTENSYLLVFEVEDTGVGMTSEELTQVFEPFVQADTTKDQSQGTGLGLFIAKKLVRLMGGEIKVKSTKNHGTLFQFKIRVNLPEASEIPLVQDRSSIIGLAEVKEVFRLLIVDDKPKNRQLLVRLLTPLGFGVKEASNGQEALEIWSDWQPHLIFMDTKMPIMDGYHTIQRIKAEEKQTTPIIIAVTAGVIDENRANLLVSSCDGILKKPFQVDLVLDILAEHLGVKYRYNHEDSEALINSKNTLNDVNIETQDLGKMPFEWIEKVNQAASMGHQQKLLTLIDEMGETPNPLQTALRQLITDFDFRKIRELTQVVMDRHEENLP